MAGQLTVVFGEDLVVPKGPKLLQAGQVLGEWTLLKYLPSEYNADRRRVKKAHWICQCSCGTQKEVIADRLSDGTSRSCGHSVPKPVQLGDHVREVVKLYGDIGVAARALEIEPDYMRRLANGEKLHPDDDVLAKLGLHRKVLYVRNQADVPLRRADRKAVNSVFALGSLG